MTNDMNSSGGTSRQDGVDVLGTTTHLKDLMSAQNPRDLVDHRAVASLLFRTVAGVVVGEDREDGEPEVEEL